MPKRTATLVSLYWAITMFRDFQWGLPIVALWISMFSIISNIETSKIQEQLLESNNAITEILKSLKEHYEGENKTWQTNNNNIFKIILPWMKTSTSDNKTWEK